MKVSLTGYVEELALAAAALLITVGLWAWIGRAALIVPGGLLLWIVLPPRGPFLRGPSEQLRGRRDA